MATKQLGKAKRRVPKTVLRLPDLDQAKSAVLNNLSSIDAQRGYRTLHGAEVGDLFMTLIHTCQLCGANSFDYLTELQRHAQELAANPAVWMPWNYRENP